MHFIEPTNFVFFPTFIFILFCNLVIGFVCCVLRILFCVCPSSCISSSRRKLKQKNAKIDADHTTSLLRDDSKRIMIAKGALVNQSFVDPVQSTNKL